MNFRPLAGTIAALAIAGCAQGTLPSPGAGVSVPSITERTTAPKLNFFDLQSGGSWPDFIVAGPQHAMWFTEFYLDAIGRISMDGHLTIFTIPNGDPEGIAIGPDHNIWYTAPGWDQIGRMTPAGKTTVFKIAGSNPSPRGITLGPDGNMWYTEFYDGYIGRITPKGAITRFAVPEYESSPWAITTGPDGDLWFTESGADKIGRFNPTTQAFESSISVPTQDATPWGILLAPDKHVWFTERTGDKIAEVTSLRSVKEFAIAQSGSYPEALAPGSDGKLWFTQSQAGTLGRIDPKTGKFGATVTLPANSIPNGIAAGPNKNLWFCVDAYDQTNQIGEVATPLSP